MTPNPSLAFDNVIARCREVLPLADAIEAAPAQLEKLKTELGRLIAETNHLRNALASEREAFRLERQSPKEVIDRGAEEELLAKLSAAKAELLATQNKLAAVRLRVEKIASLFRRLERMRAHPSSGATGMSAVVAELVELNSVSAYRFFQDHSIGGLYYSAGTTASTADVGGTLPVGFIPTPACDPLDASALAAFYAAGPQLLLTFQFGTLSFQVRPPTTYWTATPIPGSPFRSFQLTGLGAGLSPICA